MAISLTAAANSAAQFLGVLDSGESLSSQQVTDAFAIANNLLTSWEFEQTQAQSELLSEQKYRIQELIDQLNLIGFSIATAYNLVGGTYNPATFTPPTFTGTTVTVFPDNTTPITLPLAYQRALILGLAIELAPQYNMQPSEALLKNLAEARAAANPMPGHIPIPGQSAQAQAAPKGAE